MQNRDTFLLSRLTLLLLCLTASTVLHADSFGTPRLEHGSETTSLF